MQNNKADMFSGLGETQEKAKFVNFTENVIFKSPYVFITRRNDINNYKNTFESIQNKRVAIVKGYAIQNILEKEFPTFNFISLETTTEGFEKLRNNELDIFIVNLATAKYFINRNGFFDMKVSAKTNFELKIKIGLQKDLPSEILSIIDKGVKSITEKEKSAIYSKWTEIQVQEKINYEILLYLASVLLSLFLLVFIWNRRLKNAVDEKTKELQVSLNDFDMNVIASKSDLKGNIIYASYALCQISGYTEDELIGKPHNKLRHPDMPKELFAELWFTIQNGNCWSGEIKNLKKDGGFYWVRAFISPLLNGEKEIIGYSSIRHNITDKKAVEELSAKLEQKVQDRTKELNYERKYISSILNSQDNIVISTDGIRLRTVNKAFLKLFNIKNMESFIQNFGDCICNMFDKDEPNKYIQMEHKGQRWTHYIYDNNNNTNKVKITVNNTTHIFSVTVDKFQFQEEELMVAVFTDITDLENARHAIENMHKNTKDSIEYASLIQSSLIPDNKLFSHYFDDFFTLWNPKDIVGGDIYFFVELKEKEECLLFVIDCTGHGVPGAFVTMLVKAIERQVVAKLLNNKDIMVSPAWCLQYFNQTMKTFLKQEEKNSLSNVGFDGQILYFNKKNKILKIASARNEVFYLQDGEVKKIKGDKHSVGYKDSDKNFIFTDHVIDLSNTTTFYLLTDGYWDQIGGEKQRSFGKKRLQSLIKKIEDKSMEQQKKEFINELKNYQKNNEQQDDITFIGLKVVP